MRQIARPPKKMGLVDDFHDVASEGGDEGDHGEFGLDGRGDVGDGGGGDGIARAADVDEGGGAVFVGGFGELEGFAGEFDLTLCVIDVEEGGVVFAFGLSDGDSRGLGGAFHGELGFEDGGFAFVEDAEFGVIEEGDGGGEGHGPSGRAGLWMEGVAELEGAGEGGEEVRDGRIEVEFVDVLGHAVDFEGTVVLEGVFDEFVVVGEIHGFEVGGLRNGEILDVDEVCEGVTGGFVGPDGVDEGLSLLFDAELRLDDGELDVCATVETSLGDGELIEGGFELDALDFDDLAAEEGGHVGLGDAGEDLLATVLDAEFGDVDGFVGHSEFEPVGDVDDGESDGESHADSVDGVGGTAVALHALEGACDVLCHLAQGAGEGGIGSGEGSGGLTKVFGEVAEGFISRGDGAFEGGCGGVVVDVGVAQ